MSETLSIPLAAFVSCAAEVADGLDRPPLRFAEEFDNWFCNCLTSQKHGRSIPPYGIFFQVVVRAAGRE
jgi:hypothetical protein